MTWGQHHYRTFDGRIYRFTGQCSYILAADAVADAFSVHLHNDGECDGSSDCVRTVTVYAGGYSVVLSHDEAGNPVATASGNVLNLPTNVGSLRIKKAADYRAVFLKCRFWGKLRSFVVIFGSKNVILNVFWSKHVILGNFGSKMVDFWLFNFEHFKFRTFL